MRYWMASSQDLTAKVHAIIRTAIGQYYVHKAVARGCARANIQPGSVTFIQRFGSAINVTLHFHVVFLEGVYVARTTQGLRPRFVTAEPPTDADITAVVQKISHRVMRMLRTSGETGHGEPAPSVVRDLGDCSSSRLSGRDGHVQCPRLLRFSRSLPAAHGWSAAYGSLSCR